MAATLLTSLSRNERCVSFQLLESLSASCCRRPPSRTLAFGDFRVGFGCFSAVPNFARHSQLVVVGGGGRDSLLSELGGTGATSRARLKFAASSSPRPAPRPRVDGHEENERRSCERRLGPRRGAAQRGRGGRRGGGAVADRRTDGRTPFGLTKAHILGGILIRYFSAWGVCMTTTPHIQTCAVTQPGK